MNDLRKWLVFVVLAVLGWLVYWLSPVPTPKPAGVCNPGRHPSEPPFFGVG